jgi:hypothetical protein
MTKLGVTSDYATGKSSSSKNMSILHTYHVIEFQSLLLALVIRPVR